MRKIGYVFIALSLLVTLSYQPATCQSEFRTISHKIGTNTATVDGKQTRLSVPTEIKSGTTFIFSADLGKLLGIKFPWSPRNKMADGIDSLTNTSLSFKENIPSATIDGDEFKLGVKPYIKKVGKDEFFMIPLKYSCQVFGCSVSVDKNKNLTIKKPLKILPGCWVETMGNNYRNNCAPPHSAPKGEKLVKDWSLNFGNKSTNALYFDGKVLHNNERDGWICYDAKTKKKVWSKSIADNFSTYHQLRYTNGLVFANNGPTAVNASTGEIVWQKTDYGLVAAIGDVLLAIKYTEHAPKDGDFDLVCLYSKNGELKWTTSLAKNVDRETVNLNLRDFVLGDGTFKLNEKVFELETGKFLYDFPDYLKPDDKYGKRIVAFDKILKNYVISSLKGICTVDEKTGKQKGIVETEVSPTKIAVDNGKIFYFDYSMTELHCIDGSNLKNIWTINLKDEARVMVSADFQILVIDHKFISAFGKGTGKLVWSHDISRLQLTPYSCVVVDQNIYINTWDVSGISSYRFSVEP